MSEKKKNPADMTPEEFKAHLNTVSPELPARKSALVVSAQGLALSESEKERRLQNALKLWHHSNLKEWQVIVMRGAAMWEFKTQKREDVAQSICASERSRQRYQLIGQRMFEMAIEELKRNSKVQDVNPLAFEFTQKIITDTFEGFFTNGHVVTVTGLAKASANLETFKAYVRGEIDGDAHSMKLLEASNEISDKRLESKEQKTLTDKEKERDFHERMRTVAQAHGFKWDRVACRFTQVDGTPLTEEQQAELILPTDAMRMWRDVYKEVRMTTQRIASLANVGFKQFELFSRIPNTKFQQEVDDIAAGIDTQINNLLLLKDALLARDIERVQEIAKHSEDC